MTGTPPWENPAMTEGSDKYGFSDPGTDIERMHETYRTVTANPGSPRGRGVHYPEMFLYAVGTGCRFGN